MTTKTREVLRLLRDEEHDFVLLSAGDRLWIASELDEDTFTFVLADGQTLTVRATEHQKPEQDDSYPVPDLDWITELA